MSRKDTTRPLRNGTEHMRNLHIQNIKPFCNPHETAVQVSWGEYGENNATIWYEWRNGNLNETLVDDSLSLDESYRPEVLDEIRRQLLHRLFDCIAETMKPVEWKETAKISTCPLDPVPEPDTMEAA